MSEKASLDFRSTKSDERRNQFLDDINRNDLMTEKYKKKCKYLILYKTSLFSLLPVKQQMKEGIENPETSVKYTM